MYTPISIFFVHSKQRLYGHTSSFQTLVVCAEVIGCSSVRQYQQQSLGGGGGGAQYQLITLRLLSSSSLVSSGTDAASKKASCIAYLILFDDQVCVILGIPC